MKRCRAILHEQLAISLVAALSKGNCSSIADLLRQFNGMCLSAEDSVAYKPYHNQLRKEEFPIFMRQLVMQRYSPLLIHRKIQNVGSPNFASPRVKRRKNHSRPLAQNLSRASLTQRRGSATQTPTVSLTLPPSDSRYTGCPSSILHTPRC